MAAVGLGGIRGGVGMATVDSGLGVTAVTASNSIVGGLKLTRNDEN